MLRMKDELLWIAEYERHWLDAAVAQMAWFTGQGSELMHALRLFIDLAGTHGRVYLLEDLTRRII